MSAPVAPKVSHTWNRPTGPVDDPWAWLRDRDNPDTIAYLEAENAHSRAWFAQRQASVDTVFAEIKRRVQETDLAAPVFHGGWWYATRTEEGANYPIHCRGRSVSQATEHVILDENVEAEGLEYFAVGVSELNHEHTLLAWSADDDGSEQYTLRIRDLSTGTDLADEIVDTTWAGAAWSADHQWLFYVTADEQMRPCTVWRHRVGTPQSDDVQVFHDPDERFFVGVELTRSGEFIMIESGSKVSSEIHVLPSNDPTVTPHMVRAREADVEYSLDHWGDQWVVLTNLDAVDFRVCTAPHDAPHHWTELVPHVAGQRIGGLEAFHDHLVLSEWVNAQPRLRVLFRSGGERVLEISDEPHDVELESNPDYASTTIRYATQSLTKPGCVYEVDATGGTPRLLKATPTPNTDLTRYTSSRHWAVASDGTRVPVDIVHHVDTPLNGTAPIVVYGYGSYEISLPPWFSVARLSLLDRGVVWALVHPRGGGELGRRWYLDGKLLHKRNTFTDTIACIEHLVGAGVGASDGGSPARGREPADRKVVRAESRQAGRAFCAGLDLFAGSRARSLRLRGEDSGKHPPRHPGARRAARWGGAGCRRSGGCPWRRWVSWVSRCALRAESRSSRAGNGHSDHYSLRRSYPFPMIWIYLLA